jgi:hypothetical protein
VAATARTVAQVVAEYVDHAKHHLRRWRDIERKLTRHVLPVLGDRPAKDVRRADVAELLDSLGREAPNVVEMKRPIT